MTIITALKGKGSRFNRHDQFFKSPDMIVIPLKRFYP